MTREEVMKIASQGGDLSWTDLSSINLKGANLSGVNLSNADLTDAVLSEANLQGADLSNADLPCASLCSANLRGANLSGANLTKANLSGADLNCVNLIGAELNIAILQDTNLTGTKGALMEYRKGKVLTEPLIGYKKCQDEVIVTLEIPEGATVFSINGYKCRTNRVKVVAVDGANEATSYRGNLMYHVGDVITINDFDLRYNIECATGIHFLMNRKDAENYIF